MIQDVKIRWESTWIMLFRAYTMKNVIKLWLKQDSSNLRVLDLNRMKWEQMRYIVDLLKLFQKVIEHLSEVMKSSIHKVWKIYNDMHAHLETQKTKIKRRSQVQWTKQLVFVILIAKSKLTKYYDATVDVKKDLFNVEILLNSCVKSNFYAISDILHSWIMIFVFYDVSLWCLCVWFLHKIFEKYLLMNVFSHRTELLRIVVSTETTSFAFTRIDILIVSLINTSLEMSLLHLLRKVWTTF